MPLIEVIHWDHEDDPKGNVQHIAANGLRPEEVEEVLDSAHSEDDTRRSSGRPARRGWTSTGKFIFVVYEILEDVPCSSGPSQPTS